MIFWAYADIESFLIALGIMGILVVWGFLNRRM